MRTQAKPTIVAATLAVALALAACGGDDEEAGGPASLVPADAPAYVEVAVQPEGEAADDAQAALAKVTGSEDPGGDLVALFERAAGGEVGDFEEDIEPWLGERLGTYPSSLAGDTDATLVIETTDAEAALESVRDAEGGGDEQEYEGHSFEVTSDGDAFGLVEDFLVFGAPAGFEQVVDTAEGAEALGDSDGFEDAVDELPDDALLSLYAVPRNFIGAIPNAEIDPQGRRFLLQALDDSAEEPVLGSVTASGEAITLELLGAGGELATDESKLLGQVPSDSWLALAFSGIGKAVKNGLAQIREAGIPGLNPATVREQLSAATGIDLEQEVIGALGDAALFAGGSSDESLGGALVIQSTDAEASASLLEKIQELISSEAAGEVEVEPLASTAGDQGFQVTPLESTTDTTSDDSEAAPSLGLNQAITVIQRDDRIVAAYGGEALNQALTVGASEPLNRNRDFRDAQEAVGDLGIDAFLSFAPVIQIAESAGAAADPDFKQLKPYLSALSFLAIGSGGEGDRALVRFMIGLK